MNSLPNRLRRNIPRMVAAVLVVFLFFQARVPEISAGERLQLASRFHFTRHTLPSSGDLNARTVRPVQPSLKRISAWISSVGAAIAAGDLDGDGLSNDTCLVDPRSDQVTIAPAPTTGERYKPFTLRPASYDPETMAPMGCLIGDLNEDGLADIVVYYWGRTPVAFLRTGGTPGHASVLEAKNYQAVELVPGNQRWFTNAALFADLDGDGHPDLIIGNYFQDGGHILDASANGVETMHNTKSRSFNGGSKHVLLWKEAGGGEHPFVRFEEAKNVFSLAVEHGWTLGAGAQDLHGDLLPELYFAHDFGPDRLLHNRSTPGHLAFDLLEGTRGFTTPASNVLGRDSFKGMGVDFADVNGDGIPDIFVSNIADDYALQESHFLWLSTGDKEAMKKGKAPYVQASERLGLSRSGWGWDARMADFDNDGQLEIVQATGFMKGKINRWPELQSLGTSNDSLIHDPRLWPGFKPGDDVSGDNKTAFFVQAADHRYYNIAEETGLAIPANTRGIAVADVDGDGRLDFIIADQWGDSYLYKNEGSSQGAFLGLHLVLPVKGGPAVFRERAGHPGPDLYGRPAFGATAVVELPDGRKFSAQVDGGSGHSGKRSPDLHFGLGRISPDTLLRVNLAWRNSNGQVVRKQIDVKPGWHSVELGSE
ncbi:MAG TPA: CRTAC1 family protein [Candidatus Angelobacter sp.]|nr:MAG: RNA-binding protein [Candidatus Angelobacter sp. Gp1-AA117]HMC30143.1 CRTAC1 family protein [Candidatus Angelobacter sp.]